MNFIQPSSTYFKTNSQPLISVSWFSFISVSKVFPRINCFSDNPWNSRSFYKSKWTSFTTSFPSPVAELQIPERSWSSRKRIFPYFFEFCWKNLFSLCDVTHGKWGIKHSPSITVGCSGSLVCILWRFGRLFCPQSISIQEENDRKKIVKYCVLAIITNGDSTIEDFYTLEKNIGFELSEDSVGKIIEK